MPLHPRQQIDEGGFVLFVEGRSWLIEQHKRILDAHQMLRGQAGARNLQRLAAREIVCAGIAPHVDVQTCFLNDLFRDAYHRAAVDELTPPRVAALLRQDHVLEDGDIQDQRLLLEHPADAMCERFAVALRRERPAAIEHAAAVRFREPRYDIEQRRLACAVLSHKTDNRSRRCREAHVVQNADRPVTLRQPGDPKELGPPGSRRRRHRFTPS